MKREGKKIIYYFIHHQGLNERELYSSLAGGRDGAGDEKYPPTTPPPPTPPPPTPPPPPLPPPLPLLLLLLPRSILD